MKRFKKTVDATVDGAVDRTTTRMTDKVKTHFRENKKVYLAFAGGALLVYVANGRSDAVVSKSLQLGYKSTQVNVPVQTVYRRPGPKSYLVRDLDTNKIYPSQGEVARELEVSPALVSLYLNGKIDHLGGETPRLVREGSL